jgi:endonuclease/exonuclease/phosphatase family metal-dependent hydrolase
MIRVIVLFFIFTIALALFFFLILKWVSSKRLNEESGVAILATHSQLPPERDTVTLIALNVGFFMSNGVAEKRSHDSMMRNMESFSLVLDRELPDIVALQEIDLASRRTYFVNQLNWLANNHNFSNNAFALAWNKQYVPYPGDKMSSHYGPMASGLGLLTNQTLLSNTRIKLAKSEKLKGVGPGKLAQWLAAELYTDRVLHISKLAVSGQELIVMNVHLENSNAQSRERQVKDLLSEYKKINENMPVLVVGDFNSMKLTGKNSNTLTGEEIDWFKNDATIHLMLKSFRSISATSAEPSFPSWRPRLRFDYVFFNQWIEPVEEKVLTDCTASDHLPVLFRFKIRSK